MLLPFALSLALLPLTQANTEILNFAATPRADARRLHEQAWPPTLPLSTTSHHTIHKRAPYGTPLDAVCAATKPPPESLNTNGGSCPHELWFLLDFDLPSQRYSNWHLDRWTLRISWPASTPTHFTLDVLDPLDAAAALNIPFQVEVEATEKKIETQTKTKRKYARIRAVDAGVRTPGPRWRPDFWYLLEKLWTSCLDQGARSKENAHQDQDGEDEEKVEFVITLERLWLGAVPETVMPFLGVAVLVMGGLVWGGVVNSVVSGVEGLVEDAKREVKGEKQL
ncbi:hypothetical protein R3P38DRAFT_3416349 [Favolaschia claudopus]|uniref:Uncharacterized protein n=1 Tax=Favolaschia claudopus TaxID=2862362 RepID=A0AAW0EGT6_9AGAR